LDHVHLEASAPMDHIAGAPVLDRVTKELGIDEELGPQALDERSNVATLQLNDEIYVVRGPDLAVHGAGHRTTDEVGDSKSLQAADDRCHRIPWRDATHPPTSGSQP
jgi:hypothetical protein